MGATGRELHMGDEKKARKGRSPMRKFWSAVSFSLLAAAVVTELRKPKAERTWHGQLAGVVPYDLRVPTVSRLKASVWSPDDPRLFLPRAAGVGWSPNVGRIARLTTNR
jgi:hypothetical protein